MKYTENSVETDLIEGCRKRNRLAQKYLYQKYYGKMMSIAMRYAGNQDEALDILNTAMLKVFNGMDKYKARQKSSFSGWVATIVSNTAIDHVRRNTNYRRRMDFNVEREPSISGMALENLATEDLFKIIQKLPKATRTVFSMYAIDGFKHREIADRLSISEGTSKWHLATAKKELQRLILAHENGERRVS